MVARELTSIIGQYHPQEKGAPPSFLLNRAAILLPPTVPITNSIFETEYPKLFASLMRTGCPRSGKSFEVNSF
jgi:hypothetical protein